MNAVDLAYNLLTIFGIAFVIFVHELGHFLAARSVGVRVEAFSIGFGPRLFGFKRGDTDWKICLIPLGGFVKMAGEQIATPDAPSHSAAPDEFLAKTFLQKTWIISAGVIMNIVFAAVALPLAFAIGVPFEPPVIGAVKPGGDGWKAGLRAGDRITHVDGTAMLAFEDLATAIAIGGDTHTLDVRSPDGTSRTLSVPMTAGTNGTLRSLGVFPVFKNPVVGEPKALEAGDVDPSVHRAKAGFLAGDVIVDVDGLSVSEAMSLDDLAAFRSRRVGVERAGARVVVELPPLAFSAPDTSDRLLGLDASATRVVAIRGDSPWAAVVRSDDRILAVDGRRVVTEGELVAALANTASKTMCVRRGETLVAFDLPGTEGERARTFLRDVAREADGLLVSPRAGGPAAAVGLKSGDRIVAVNGTAVSAFTDLERWADEDTVELSVVGTSDAKIPVSADLAAFGTTPSVPEVRTASFKVSRGPVPALPASAAFMGLEQAPMLETVNTSAAGAIPMGLAYLSSTTNRVLLTLRRLVDRSVPANNLGGIITIFKKSAQSAKIAPSRGLLFLAVISVNLAVLNILPIPILDGGWLLLLAIERLRRGRPIPEKVLGAMQWAGLILVLGLMVFVTWNDIRRWFLG